MKNFGNLEVQYTDQEWDPGNKYSICKDWGTTGYAYDTTKIAREMSTWQDFIDVAMNEASGNVSILDSPDNVDRSLALGQRHQLDDRGHGRARRSAEDFLLNELAPHVKAFVSYPGGGDMQNGNFALVHAWNGDARQGIVDSPTTPTAGSGSSRGRVPRSGWTPTRSPSVRPTRTLPTRGWTILLQPEISLKELEYIGYHTGVKGIQPRGSRRPGSSASTSSSSPRSRSRRWRPASSTAHRSDASRSTTSSSRLLAADQT